jgi:hypothetical protein
MVPRNNFLRTHISGVPQHQRDTLVFAYASSVPGVTGTFSEAGIFNLNSAYDPNGSTSAAQPAGYAKYMTFYSKCYVVAARIKVKMCAYINASEIQPPNVLGVTISTLGSSLSTYTQAIEIGLCDWSVVQYSPDFHQFTESIDVAKFLFRSKVIDDPQLFSTVSANPGQLITAHLWSYPLISSSQGIANICYGVEIEQECIFSDPIPFT